MIPVIARHCCTCRRVQSLKKWSRKVWSKSTLGWGPGTTQRWSPSSRWPGTRCWSRPASMGRWCLWSSSCCRMSSLSKESSSYWTSLRRPTASSTCWRNHQTARTFSISLQSTEPKQDNWGHLRPSRTIPWSYWEHLILVKSPLFSPFKNWANWRFKILKCFEVR